MNVMDCDLPKRLSSLARSPEIILGGFAFLLSFQVATRTGRSREYSLFTTS